MCIFVVYCILILAMMSIVTKLLKLVRAINSNSTVHSLISLLFFTCSCSYCVASRPGQLVPNKERLSFSHSTANKTSNVYELSATGPCFSLFPSSVPSLYSLCSTYMSPSSTYYSSNCSCCSSSSPFWSSSSSTVSAEQTPQRPCYSMAE